MRLEKTLLDEEYKRLMLKSRFDFDFFVSSSLAVIIALLGFKMDNSVVIIGSMLISPLIYPLLSISSAIAWKRSSDFVKRSLLTIIFVSFLIFLSAVISFVLNIDQTGVEVIQRLEADYSLYFFVAVFSGVASSFAFYWPGVMEAITGTSISVALLPPLVMIGMGIGSRDLDLFQNSLSIFLFNFIGIVLGCLVTVIWLRLTQVVSGKKYV